MESEMAGTPWDEHARTTLHVRAAAQGEEESMGWLVERFSPLLLANARYRMGKALLATIEPEDVVSEVWAIAIPRLTELTPRSGRYTPVVVRFLSRTLTLRINRLLERLLSQQEHLPQHPGGHAHERAIDQVAENTTAVCNRAARSESVQQVLRAIDELDPIDRDLVILRAAEQGRNKDVARIMGLDPGTAAVRYFRALEHLRARFPGSIFDDLRAKTP